MKDDDLEAIRARHVAAVHRVGWAMNVALEDGLPAHVDRGLLIAEIDRLRAVAKADAKLNIAIPIDLGRKLLDEGERPNEVGLTLAELAIIDYVREQAK